jgi:hypothetical protein
MDWAVTDTNDYVGRHFFVPVASAPAAAPKAKYKVSKKDVFGEFHALLSQWRRETVFTSLARDKIAHPAFKKIVKMDRIAVPWILKEIRHQPDFLVLALHSIVKDENPVPAGARGKINEMVNAWLDWANRKHFDAD